VTGCVEACSSRYSISRARPALGGPGSSGPEGPGVVPGGGRPGHHAG
jgi:hypothetical protein